MKRWILIIGFFLHTAVIACPVCERQQPKILRGVVHGQGPDSSWDYIIVWSIVAITVITFVFSVKWLLRPGEKNKVHIKYSILNKDEHEQSEYYNRFS